VNTSSSPDPSVGSFYLDDAFYERLVAFANDWQNRTGIECGERPDLETRDDCAALISAEARLADALQLESWLDCYAPECIYWIPASNPAADPRLEITHEIHDRRRLEDRVARIRTGFAYSMTPAVRSTHVLGPVEIWRGMANEVRARTSFIIDTFRNDHHRVLSGWVGYSIVDIDGQWRIAIKQVNLIDADQPQGNNSFFL